MGRRVHAAGRGTGAATPIHAVQGSGTASPVAGAVEVIEGVVVGDYQDTATQLGGFYLQEEDGEIDGDAATSEGIFVYDGGFGVRGLRRSSAGGDLPERLGMMTSKKETDSKS